MRSKIIFMAFLVCGCLTVPADTEVQQERKHVYPRAIGGTIETIDSVLGLASSVLGVVDFPFGSSFSSLDRDQNNKLARQFQSVKNQIILLNERLENMFVWQQIASLYGNDVQRLLFLLDYLDDLPKGDNGGLRLDDRAMEWADEVLDLGSNGLPNVMKNFHDLMTGESFFATPPLLFLFVQSLDTDSSDFYQSLRDFEDYLESIQVSGYAAILTALNVKSREREVSDNQAQAEERLEEQRELRQNLWIQLWSDRC